MKILNFAVNNFGGINGGLEQNRINFDNSNTIFIFGQNNVGKSTFLRAYKFFYDNETPKLEDVYEKDNNNIEFELELELDQYDFDRISRRAPSKTESIKKFLKDGKILKVLKVFETEKTGDKITIKKAKNLTFNPETLNWENSNYGSLGLDGVFQRCLPTPIFIKAMPTEKEIADIVNKILKGKAEKKLKERESEEYKEAEAKIKELQKKMYNPEAVEKYKEEVNKYYQKLFPDTKIELEEKDKISWTENKIGKNFNILFQKVDINGDVEENIPADSSKIGHGSIRAGIFSLMLMRDVAEEFERINGRKDYLILFEEPELFLHPCIMRQLRSLIYSVSENDFPYQILCASHSPAMIDLSKERTSIVRMLKENNKKTKINQLTSSEIEETIVGIGEAREQKQQFMYEVLRFNPYLCESFYANEVVLVEGPTEEIILRGYLQEKEQGGRDIFVVNCGTINNIPFYQKIFSTFGIKYNVIFDTDNNEILEERDCINPKGLHVNIPKFGGGIRKKISDKFLDDFMSGLAGGIYLNDFTFEPSHQSDDIPEGFHYPYSIEIEKHDYEYKYDLSLKDEGFKKWHQIYNGGKVLRANFYWKYIIYPNITDPEIKKLPIINAISEIVDRNEINFEDLGDC
ncbi:MAG: ATP-dependent endonuclease [Candidatus Gracilibacteria bacterium]|nr:ATP-dependent endonuclease [Candidatus Gracilibacteria bacterium]